MEVRLFLGQRGLASKLKRPAPSFQSGEKKRDWHYTVQARLFLLTTECYDLSHQVNTSSSPTKHDIAPEIKRAAHS